MKRFGMGNFGVLSIGPVLAALTLAGGLVVAGCGDSKGNSSNDSGGLPDGFLLTTCSTVDDCTPTKCQTAKCNPVTKMCVYTDKVCTADSACSMGKCDDTTGECVQQPGNDAMACTTDTGAPGTCGGGTCAPVPSCDDGSGYLNTIYCDPGSLSQEDGDNTPSSFGGGAAIIDSYACAPGEAGPEVAYTFSHDSSAGDEDITLSLRLVDDAGKILADQTLVDLDLLVLEDVCTGSAICMNPAAASGFQGVTAGTSAERFTFRAAAGKNYYVVVDSKSMTAIHPYRVEIESCGKCQPTAGTRLDCNMSMPVSTSTSGGMAQLTNYTCGAAKTAVAAAGKEIPFFFVPTGDAKRNVTATLSGATQPYKMFALPITDWGQCDPANCIDYKEGASGAASITWATDPGSSGFERFWVVVDTPTTTDTSFGMTVSCAPYCTSIYSLRCGGSFETTKVTGGTTIGKTNQADHWGPAAGCDSLTGLVGPDTAVTFTPTILINTTYEVRLVSNTAGVNLSMTILDAGTTAAPACNPTATCMANTVQSGASFSGTRTTAVATSKAAATRFTAVKGHTYFIVVDGTATAGASFDMQVVGIDSGAGCGAI